MHKNFAILGCGQISNRHADQISRLGNVKAVCDIIPERANILADRFDATPYNSLDELLSFEKELDVMSICTPNGLHAQHAIKTLAANIHVLCEKPLCINVNEGEKMLHAAKQSGKKLFVVKQNRYNPPVAFLKQLIESGKLGKIYSFQVNCFWNRPIQYYVDWKGTKALDGGTLFTQFSHFIDLIYWLFGDVNRVKTTRQNFAHPSVEFEDTGMILFEMKGGTIGSMNYTVNSFQKNMEGSLSLFAEKGTVKIGGQYLNELEYFSVADMDPPILAKGNTANTYGFYQGSMSNHDKVYNDLINALSDTNSTLASAAEGLKTVEIIERIYREDKDW
jgi:UDP-N-acetyl-2-amino-2-deoxyglucuronate dehydrogenase